MATQKLIIGCFVLSCLSFCHGGVMFPVEQTDQNENLSADREGFCNLLKDESAPGELDELDEGQFYASIMSLPPNLCLRKLNTSGYQGPKPKNVFKILWLLRSNPAEVFGNAPYGDQMRLEKFMVCVQDYIMRECKPDRKPKRKYVFYRGFGGLNRAGQ